MTTVLPIAHASLGASSAHRWMACPGSVRLIAENPSLNQRESSPHAREGTAAHELAAELLTNGGLAVDHIGRIFTVEGYEIPVTVEMATNVQMYVDLCLGARDAMGTDIRQVLVEASLSLEKLNPPVPMFGTGDYVLIGHNTVQVWDYKNGAGVRVDAQDNPQLLYYALGAVLLAGRKVREVQVHIVQPRIPRSDGSIVSSATYTWDQLIAFKERLLDAARATQRSDAVLVAGSHCRWCPVSPICPAQANQALAVAQDDFSSPPTLATLTAEDLSYILDKAPLVEAWFNSVREHVRTVLEEGGTVPGWHLSPKRATRRWVDEAHAEKYLRRKIGAKQAYTRKLISPAQAEKLVQKLPGTFVVAESSGYNITRGKEETPGPVRLKEAQAEFSVDS